MKYITLILLAISIQLSHAQSSGPSLSYPPVQDQAPSRERTQIALLLDTSGSMDDLLHQAQAQLWQILNELSYASHSDYLTDLEVALYEYGSSRISVNQRYIRQVMPFSQDWDLLSERLYSLRTGGNKEYCGAAIQAATQQLRWDRDPHTQKMIFIAGNESFAQGSISYTSAIQIATRKGIVVHSIYCGDYQQGITHKWQDAVLLGGGSYQQLSEGEVWQQPHIPHEDELMRLSQELNQTYLPYGAQGRTAKQRQLQQDANTARYGSRFAAERAILKASATYHNPDWDLVDAYETGTVDLNTLIARDIPFVMRSMDRAQQVAYLHKQAQQRKIIRSRIQGLQQGSTKQIEAQQASTSLAQALRKSTQQQRAYRTPRKPPVRKAPINPSTRRGSKQVHPQSQQELTPPASPKIPKARADLFRRKRPQ